MVLTFTLALFAAAALAPLTAADDYAPLVLFDGAAARARGALCLDGSTPGMYFRPARDPAHARKWVLYLHGGGWCYDEDDCAARAYTFLGSSTRFPKTLGFASGPVGPDPATNPTFGAWNHALLMYCDGASFAGDRADTVSWADPARPGHNMTLYFRGRRILEFALDQLLPGTAAATASTTPSGGYGLGSATHVLLSGGSAGGLATYLHADFVQNHLRAWSAAHGVQSPLVQYRAAPVSGYFLKHSTGGAAPQPTYPDELEYVFHMQNASRGVNADCLAAQAHGQEHLCIFANYSYKHTKTPMFLLQGAVDAWQMGNIWKYDTTCWKNHLMTDCTDAQIDDLNGYADDLLANLKVRPSRMNTSTHNVPPPPQINICTRLRTLSHTHTRTFCDLIYGTGFAIPQ